jgi:hypothetical protein
MEHVQDVEEDVQLVGKPEEFIGTLSDDGVGKNKDYDHETVKQDSGRSSESLEEPETDVRFDTRRNGDLFGHALEMVWRLGANMVKVDKVANGMDDGKEEPSTGTDFVKLKMCINRNVLMD